MIVSAPGLGDGIQAMKAGLLEIADILVVNKADRKGADRTSEELSAALALRSAGGQVPVLKTAAVTGAGVPELWRLVLERGEARKDEGLEKRRRRRARYLIARAASDLIAARIRQGDEMADALADAVLTGEAAPLEAAARLINGVTG